MKDLYSTLGVKRGATDAEIKQAYRKMATKHHPDKGGDTKLFQEITAAYNILSDPQKRAQYDNPSPFGDMGGFHQQSSPFDLDGIFSMFGARFHHPGFQQQRRAQMQLWITLEDVARGGARAVSVGTQHSVSTVEIDIPVGLNDGDSVQYPGIGPGGIDLLVTFRIHPNPRFQRQGLNLITDQPISVWDLILGASIEIKDLLGNNISLEVPARTQPGTLMRLKGRGLPARGLAQGDLLVRLQARIPDAVDPELLAVIEQKHRQ